MWRRTIRSIGREERENLAEQRAVQDAEGPTPANPSGLVVAGWLVAVEPGRVAEVRTALDALAGTECRGEPDGRLVVVTESPAVDLDRVHEQLRSVGGVRDAAMVAVYEI